MTVYAVLYTLHVLAAVLWVGGMFFAWAILRPAAVAQLQAPERLKLWQDVFRRFFVWVWIAVIVLPVAGFGIWHMRFNGFAGAPAYVHAMAGLYVVMLAVFLRVLLVLLPRLEKAIAAEQWQEGGAVLGKIRHAFGGNLMVGLLVIALAAARPLF